jgi:hypothetical protein
VGWVGCCVHTPAGAAPLAVVVVKVLLLLLLVHRCAWWMPALVLPLLSSTAT